MHCYLQKKSAKETIMDPLIKLAERKRGEAMWFAPEATARGPKHLDYFDLVNTNRTCKIKSMLNFWRLRRVIILQMGLSKYIIFLVPIDV